MELATFLTKIAADGNRNELEFTNGPAAIIKAVADLSTCIIPLLREADLHEVLGDSHKGENASGDTVKQMDHIADEIFAEGLSKVDSVYALGSEEKEGIEVINEDGAYTVFYDPLDGSSNLDAHIPVGTIFAIWHREDTSPYPEYKTLVAAGYVLFSTATQLVFSVGNKPCCAIWSDRHNEWVVVREELEIPEPLKCVAEWRSQCSARYIGSMVADIHRNLLYGGIFAYPSDTNNPDGKLRVLYECFPMGWLIEAAGGKASTGKFPLGDVKVHDLHQKTSVFIGHAKHIEACENKYRRQDRD